VLLLSVGTLVDVVGVGQFRRTDGAESIVTGLGPVQLHVRRAEVVTAVDTEREIGGRMGDLPRCQLSLLLHVPSAFEGFAQTLAQNWLIA